MLLVILHIVTLYIVHVVTASNYGLILNVNQDPGPWIQVLYHKLGACEVMVRQ